MTRDEPGRPDPTRATMRVNRPFADCKTDELHLADAIQSFGAMVVLDRDDAIVAVSGNSDAFLGAAPQDLLGTDARAAMPSGIDLDAVRADAEATRPAHTASTVPLRPKLRTLDLGDRPSVVAVHARGDRVIVEAQAAGDDAAGQVDTAAIVQRLSDDLEGASSEEGAAGMLVDAIAALTGYDRVLAYRFLPGWHGEVVAERLAPGLSGYLGLRFPESDIPANARRLYLAKRQRIVADVGASTVPVFGVRERMQLDLTGSELRAVHPVHIEYLKNMGVAASFSVSIVVKGRLWGLVACHHMTPRSLGPATRQACELVATIASLQVANLERVQHVLAVERHDVALDRALLAFERTDGPQLAATLAGLRAAFRADGVVAELRERGCRDGDVPDDGTLRRLRALCDAWPDDAVTAGSQVPAALADDPAAVRAASGILHVPLGEDGHVTFLRREQVETIDWAGRPPHVEEPRAGPLGPRTSFEIWREATRGRAVPWTEADVEGADDLREALIEHLERLELERRASTDALTGLANRAMFETVLAEAVGGAERGSTALLMVDLDRFKEVNDTFGHPVGDELLETVAERLRGTVRGRDVAARLGGDEFAVILRDVPSRAALSAAADRVVRALGAPYELEDGRFDVQASVGAALVAAAGDTPDAVVARADRALYAAKDAGRGRYELAPEQATGGDGAGAADGGA